MGFFSNASYKSAISTKNGAILNTAVNRYLNYPSNENYQNIENVINQLKIKKQLVSIIIEHSFKDYALELSYHKDMTEENWNNFKVICKQLNITIPEKEYQILFNRYALLAIDAFNKLPISYCQNNDILLKQGEVLYYSTPASIRKYKTKTKSIGYAGPTVSIPIVKGVRYRVGSMKVAKQTETTLENTDTGYFYITNNRVLFVGEKENFAYPISKLIKIGATSEGLLLHKENTVNPKILGVLNYNLALSILSAIINEDEITLFDDKEGIPPADRGETPLVPAIQPQTATTTTETPTAALKSAELTDEEKEIFKKKRLIAYALMLLPTPLIFVDPHPYLPMGFLGIHRFYLKEWKWGLLELFTGNLFLLGFIYDLATLGRHIKQKALEK